MTTSDQMHYRVHLPDGTEWFCGEYGYAKNLLESIPDFVDADIDVAMRNAIPVKYFEADVRPSDVVHLPRGAVAVELLNEPRTPRWYRDIDRRLPAFEGEA